MMVDYISRSSRGLSVYLAVGITQSVLMSDRACTAVPPSRFGLPFIHSSLTVRVSNGWISRVAPTPSMTLLPTTHPEVPTTKKPE